MKRYPTPSTIVLRSLSEGTPVAGAEDLHPTIVEDMSRIFDDLRARGVDPVALRATWAKQEKQLVLPASAAGSDVATSRKTERASVAPAASSKAPAKSLPPARASGRRGAFAMLAVGIGLALGSAAAFVPGTGGQANAASRPAAAPIEATVAAVEESPVVEAMPVVEPAPAPATVAVEAPAPVEPTVSAPEHTYGTIEIASPAKVAVAPAPRIGTLKPTPSVAAHKAVAPVAAPSFAAHRPVATPVATAPVAAATVAAAPRPASGNDSEFEAAARLSKLAGAQLGKSLK